MLTLKRDYLAKSDLQAMQSLSDREEQLAAWLQQCHQRRQHLLELSAQTGVPSASIRQLTASMPPGRRSPLEKQVEAVSSKLRMLQHQSLTNWVLAQRAVLHLAQLLEIVATGGRIRPTYCKGQSAHSRGVLVDRAV